MERESKLDLDFEIEPLALREFGVIGIASHICGLHPPKIRVNNYISYESFSEDSLKKTKADIVKFISLKTNLRSLPKAPTAAILTKVLELCDKVHFWRKQVIQDLKFHKSYGDIIYFTSRGAIDTVRIFRSYWMRIPGPQPEGWFFQKFNPLHLLACLFDIEYLSHFQTDIINEIESNFPGIQIDPNSNPTFRIMSIVIYCYKTFLIGMGIWVNHMGNTIGVNELSETKLTTSAMLEICNTHGFYQPFIYFYNHLDAIEEQNFLETTSKSNLYLFEGKEREFQFQIFLLKKMNASQRNNYISQNFLLLFSHFLVKESYQKFCVPLLDTKFQNISLLDPNYQLILREIFRVLKQNENLGIDSEFHIQVFRSLLEKIPINIKKDIFLSGKIINELYDISCIPVLRLVINDPDLETQKVQIIKGGKMKFISLIESENYKTLDKYKVEFLNSKILQDEFDKILYYALELRIMNYKFGFVYKYLTWKYAEEAEEYKITLYPLWCSFVPKIYRNIERLLIWYLGKREMPTMKNCFYEHEKILLKEFCRELIYNIWFRATSAVLKCCVDINDTAPAISLSTQILSSIFVSEEEVTKYKKTELVEDESCVRFFCEYAMKIYDEPECKTDYRFETLDEFLFKFCTLSIDKVEEIKKSIADNVEDWIRKYGVEVNRFEIIVPLLEWVYGKRTENQEMLINHFPNRDEVIRYFETYKKNSYNINSQLK